MDAYKKRVVDEKRELDDKLEKLAAFLGSPAYNELPASTRTLLDMQFHAMHTYSGILLLRIASF